MRRTWFALAAVGLLLTGGSLLARGSGAMSGGEKTSGMSSMKGDAMLQQKLEALERRAWESFKAQDFKAFKEVVATDAMSADMNGFATPDQMESMMKDYVVESYSLQDFKLVRLDKDAAILTYTANSSAKFKGGPVPAGPYYCSSTYVMRGAKWVGLFHQESLAASAMQSAAGEMNK